MTRSQLIGIVAKKAKMSKKAVAEIITATFDEMSRSLQKGEKVVVSNFGTFYISKVKDKQVVPFGQADKKQVIKAHKVVNFRVGKTLKQEIW